MDLSQDVLAALGTDDKQELEIWEELLASRGFDLLVRYLKTNSESNDAAINNAANWDGYCYARGARDAFSLVLNLEEMLTHRLNQKAEELTEESDDALEDEIDEISVNLGLR